MNTLILTPDAVGSTLLQRLLTIYMQFHEFDQPVINLHELTNGLEEFYSAEFNRVLLGKPQGMQWGYYQTLKEIVDRLSAAEHYKVARLAQYHMHGRKDPLSDQLAFYQYLDENFFIISCRRRNLFEHALSWGLNKITKKLNVYSAEEKINSFYDIYRNKVMLDLTAFEKSLHRYGAYLQWSEDNFTISSYFYYEDHVDQIEKYILNLPIFSSQSQKITWQDTYDIDFSDWNRSHYYSSNIGSIAITACDQLPRLAQSVTDISDQCLQVSDIVTPMLPVAQQQHLATHAQNYNKAQESIHRMVQLGILVSPVPIKKQTLLEKKYMIKNFDQCVDVFNAWALNHPNLATPINSSDITEFIAQDLASWNRTDQNPMLQQPCPPPTD
jgi:hypothetical protein